MHIIWLLWLCMQAQMEAKDTQIQQQDTELREKTAQINKQQNEEKELQKLRVSYLVIIMMVDSVNVCTSKNKVTGLLILLESNTNMQTDSLAIGKLLNRQILHKQAIYS